MLKYKIDTETHSALDENQKPFYEQVGDEFVLKVDGIPQADDSEVERLKQHNEKLIGEKRQRDEAARQAQAERERIEQEAAKKNGDFEALEKSYQEKLQARESELAEMRNRSDKQVMQSESQRLAAQLSDNAKNQSLLQRFINDRLTVVDGQVKVTDEQGKPSASTLADLENEFKTSGMYDSLLTGTRASGTGGTGQSGDVPEDPATMSAIKRKQLKDRDPAAFARLFPS